jgi:hypothetical protein
MNATKPKPGLPEQASLSDKSNEEAEPVLDTLRAQTVDSAAELGGLVPG